MTYVDPAEQTVPRVRDSEDPLQATLFGPPADPPIEATPENFLAFMASDDGTHLIGWLLEDARYCLGRGDKRYSVLGALHAYRHTQKKPVNNSFAPWLSDLLVKRYPALGEIIERRQRRKPGPTDGGS